MIKLRWLLTLAVAIASLPSGALAQERGVITGTVVDQATQRPLVGAQITIAGTQLGTITNQQGGFTITNVPAGTREVRASLIGFSAATRTVTVPAGGTARTEFVLAQTAVQIDALVVTATGQERRARELGNVVGNINVAEQVPLATVSTFSQVIQARSPGVTVLQSSGTSGTGSRIRIRGSNSISLSNSPLLVIDGVRINNNPESFQLWAGGQTISRLDDLNPEDIASIEILKGPAASALYGTAAANGVIQVTTRRGRAGQTQIRAYAEASSMDLNHYTWPDNFFAVGAQGVGALRRCSLVDRISATAEAPGCPGGVTQIFRGTPLNDPEFTPFRRGAGSRYGVSLSGGSEIATYHVAADFEGERGVQVDNQLDGVTLRANLTGRVRDNLRLSTNVGFTDRNVQLPHNGASFLGSMRAGMEGNPHPNFTDPNSPSFTAGYRPPLTPAMTRAANLFQDIHRLIASANLAWSAFNWLEITGTAGLDNLSRFDNGIIEPNILTPFGSPFAEGLRDQLRFQFFTYTANTAATATYAVTPDVRSTSSVGMQYIEESSNLTAASGSGISPGSRATATPRSVSEDFAQNKTFGAFVQQQFAWRDRVFLTAAARGDQNSAFGQNLDFVWYPSLSASWVVSEEEFFPQIDLLNNLRLRAAWGRSGLRPGPIDAQQSFAVAPASVRDQVTPGFIISTAGNPDLRPEVSTELETGFDLNLLDNRLGFQVTYYNKESQDALVRRPLAPSFGSAPSRVENLGAVRNTGFEMLVEAEPVRARNFGLNLTASYSTNRNELLTLGENIPPILFSSHRHVVGHPLGGYWKRPFTFTDANNDGVIQYREVTLADSVEYMGTPFPTRELALSGTLRLSNFVRIYGLLDHKGGHRQWNFGEFVRCMANLVCEAANDPNAPLEQQARIIASTTAMGGTPGASGFLEDADFWKLREVAVTLAAPTQMLSRLGLRSDALRLTLGGRNLHTWTNYTGFDPEANAFGQTDFLTVDAYTPPPARRYTLRLDMSF